jgi:tetratricopeptide (TPR) repeat protein
MTGKPLNPVHFWNELKQRRVVRAITVYIAGAFALLEAADMIFPNLGLPAWCMTFLLVIVATGLILVITLTWIFDITPEGIKRTGRPMNINSEDRSEIEYHLRGSGPEESNLNQRGVNYNYEILTEKIRVSRKKSRIYNYSSVIVIAGVIVLFTFSSANTLPFAKRNWIVITDFDNQTGNKVFDKSLYTAFTLATSQSRYINILPRSRMLETMGRMEIKDQDIIDDETGREIAIREGIDIFVIPSISQVGTKYAIGARIVDSGTGNFLRTEVVYAEKEDEILNKIDALSRKIRRSFGESRYNIAVQDKPLRQVTTSSLEALKLYSQAIDHHIRLDMEGARSFYESALKSDTGFTSAKASLGNLMYERFDREKGRELLKEAIKSVDRLTERERLGILAFYAVNVENNLPKGIEYSKMRIEMYPDDAAARNNLGWYYLNSGRLEEALSQYEATVRIFPDMAIAYNGVCWIFLEKLGKIDSAKLWSEKMISDNPENPWGYFYLGSAWFCLDSLGKALNDFKEGRELDPAFKLNLYRLAHTYRYLGQNREAIAVLEEILRIDSTEFAAYSDIGINYEDMGDIAESSRYFSRFKKFATEIWAEEFPELAETYTTIGAVDAHLNDIESSAQMLRKAMAIDSTKYMEIAGVFCLQGNNAEAIKYLEKALKSGYRDITWLKMNPDLQALRGEGRFRDLLSEYFDL